MRGRERFTIWLRAVRIPFLSAAAMPVLIGTAVAWYEKGFFDPSVFFLTFLGAVLLQAGTNLFNEYFDYISGNDQINQFRHLPFNGGTGVIIEGKLSTAQVYSGAMICYAIGTIIGIYLAITRGPFVFILGLFGLFSGYFYVGEPLKLAYRGIGEVVVGCNFGFFIVMGSYYVQVGTVSFLSVLVALPITLLITAVLYINQFPDYEADRLVGKANLVVRLGRERAVKGYYFLMILSYSVLFISVALGLMPHGVLLSIVSLPLVIKACGTLKRYYKQPIDLVPANSATLQIHLIVGLILSITFIVMGFL
mgnify:CR=1 FL=1